MCEPESQVSLRGPLTAAGVVLAASGLVWAVSAAASLLVVLAAGLVVSAVVALLAVRVAHRWVVLSWPVADVPPPARLALPAAPLAIEAARVIPGHVVAGQSERISR